MKTILRTDDRKSSRGFTLVELAVVIAIVAALAALGIVIYQAVTTPATVNGSWTIAPPTIPSTGGQFTYSVKTKIGGQWQPLANRQLTFRVAPAAHLTVSPAAGATAPGGDLVITVTPAQDYCYGGNLWVTDVASGIEDPPTHFTVTCP